MNKSFKAALPLIASMLLTSSCNTLLTNSQSTNTASNAGAGLLDNLLGTVLNGKAVSEKELIGTWTYTGVECVFESQNFLAQAGGAAASGIIEGKINDQLRKYGIKKGVTKLTFNADKTFTATLGAKHMNGTYTLDTKSKVLVLSTMSGLINLRPQIGRSGSGISLLFESDKVLSLVGTVSGLVGQMGDSRFSTLASLLKNYNGMRVGLKLSK